MSAEWMHLNWAGISCAAGIGLASLLIHRQVLHGGTKSKSVGGGYFWTG
jgi:hypothetical protein